MNIRKIKSQKGITLIALIMTVVILLILATVSINLTINGGIEYRTKLAVDKVSDEEIREQIKISYLEYERELLYKSNIDVEVYMADSLKRVFPEDISVKDLKKELKITFNDRNKIYIYKIDGTVYELMKQTENLYGYLDEDTGTLYIGATQKDNYDLFPKTTSNYYSIGKKWDTDKILKVVIEEPIATTTQYFFAGCSKMQEIENINNLHTEYSDSMFQMFCECNSLTSLNLSSFDTSNITSMAAMFADCNSLTELDLGSFNTINVKEMNGMFRGCNSLTNLDITSFDTSNATNMSSMFKNCLKLTSLDLSKFNTNNTTNMGLMFYCCYRLENLNLGRNFTMDNVTSASNMFLYAGSRIKIRTTQDTANRIKEIRTDYNDSNFEIIS